MLALQGQSETDLTFPKIGTSSIDTTATMIGTSSIDTTVPNSPEDEADSPSGQSTDAWLHTAGTLQPQCLANISSWTCEDPDLRDAPWKGLAVKGNKKHSVANAPLSRKTPIHQEELCAAEASWKGIAKKSNKKHGLADAPLTCKVQGVYQDEGVQSMPLPGWLVDTLAIPDSRDDPNLLQTPWKGIVKRGNMKHAITNAPLSATRQMPVFSKPPVICKVQGVYQDDGVQSTPFPEWLDGVTLATPDSRDDPNLLQMPWKGIAKRGYRKHAIKNAPLPAAGPMPVFSKPPVSIAGCWDDYQ